jgi:hypothetical protein
VPPKVPSGRTVPAMFRASRSNFAWPIASLPRTVRVTLADFASTIFDRCQNRSTRRHRDQRHRHCRCLTRTACWLSTRPRARVLLNSCWCNSNDSRAGQNAGPRSRTGKRSCETLCLWQGGQVWCMASWRASAPNGGYALPRSRYPLSLSRQCASYADNVNKSVTPTRKRADRTIRPPPVERHRSCGGQSMHMNIPANECGSQEPDTVQ